MENFIIGLHIVRGIMVKCVYTVPRSIEGQKIFHNWPKSYPYCTRNGVHTFGTHRSSYNMGMRRKLWKIFCTSIVRGTVYTHLCTHRSSYNMGIDFGQLSIIFCPKSYPTGNGVYKFGTPFPLTIWV